jgi:hypothetical protein
MSEYKKIEDIIQEKREHIAEYEAKIKAWESVVIIKKKNGEDFKELSNRCIQGAKMHGKYYTSGDEISVYYTGKRAYNEDSIDTYGFCDKLPDDDERKVPNAGYMRTQYTLSPAEMREAIAKRIALYKEYKAAAECALAWLEENADTIKAKMVAFREEIFAGAPDDIGIRHAFGDIVGDGIKFGFR